MEPIQLINHDTGYKIFYTLRNFYHDYNDNSTTFSGNALFEELKPRNSREQNQWEKNRTEAYNVSRNKFLRALYHDKLQEEGFLLNYLYISEGRWQISEPLTANDILLTDTVTDSKIFYIGTGANRLILTCFGRPVSSKDLQEQNRIINDPFIFLRRGGIINYLTSRNQGYVRIFSDGTFAGSIGVIPYRNSDFISGIRISNMLPFEYGHQDD